MRLHLIKMAEIAADGKVRVKRVGNYIIGKTIGEGSFAKVKLGTHLLTNERVALKIIEKSKITEASDVQRITREIQILKLLQHENVVKLYEIIDTPRHLYIIQEYLPNGELFDYIVARKRLSEDQACMFAIQIWSGLYYLHQQSISHRDLKPENCMLDANNTIKIIDFGLSNTFKNYAYLKTACGSPAYACPEMIKGEIYNGANADTWSCGIILYAMLCGALPFEASTTQGLYCKILSGNIFFPDYVSQGARDVVKQLLTIDPVKRAKIPQLFEHPWVKEQWQKVHPGVPLVLKQCQRDGSLSLRTLQQMRLLNFDLVQTIQSLKLNKHNAQTATYMLLSDQIAAGKLKTEAMADEPATLADKIAKAKELGLNVSNSGEVIEGTEVIGSLTMNLDQSQRPNEQEPGVVSKQTIAGGMEIRADLAANDYVERNRLDSQTQDEQADFPRESPNNSPRDRRQGVDRSPITAVPPLPILPQIPQGTPVHQFEVTERVEQSQKSQEPIDDFGLRKFFGQVGSGTTTKMPPDMLVQLLEEAMKKLKIKAQKERVGLFKCQRLNVIMSVEACRVASTEYCCIVFRRMTGDAWVYKELCQQLLAQLGL